MGSKSCTLNNMVDMCTFKDMEMRLYVQCPIKNRFVLGLTSSDILGVEHPVQSRFIEVAL